MSGVAEMTMAVHGWMISDPAEERLPPVVPAVGRPFWSIEKGIPIATLVSDASDFSDVLEFLTALDATSVDDMSQTHIEQHPQFQQLEAAIAESTNLPTLKDDWDGEGSKGYSKATWQRGVDLLRACYEKYCRNGAEMPPAPSIEPGPDGHIDIRWRTAFREMAISIPAEDGADIEFYGDHFGPPVIQGYLKRNSPNEWILSWLMRT